MANNRTQFSIKLDVTEPERAWLTEMTELLNQLFAFDVEPQNDWEKGLLEHGDTGFTLISEDNTAIIHHDEQGNVEIVIEILEQFATKFNRTIGIEWAYTCSTARPGEFGGGAAIIKSGKTKFLNTGTWLAQELQRQ